MKDWKSGYLTADIQDSAIHRIGEHNFLWHEHTTRHQNGYSGSGCKSQNVIQTLGQKSWCSLAHMKNWKIVPNVDNHVNHGKGLSSINMVHVGANFEGAQQLVSYNQG